MKRLVPFGYLLLVVCVILAPFTLSHFHVFQLAYVGIFLIALLGLNLLTGFAGQISLGHGAFMGIGAYTTVILVADHGWRDLWTIPVAGVVAGLTGLLFGLPATRFAGPYLALATFAVPLAFIGLLKNFGGFTGGSIGKTMPLLHSELGIHANPSVWLYGVSWVVAFVMLGIAMLLVRGRYGRSLRATRDSEIAATASGLSTALVKTSAFGVSAAFCGVAGALFTMGNAYVNPDTFPIDLSILLLVGVVVGGAGSIGGMIFGALFVEYIRPGAPGGPWLVQWFDRVPGLSVSAHAAGSPLVIYGVILLLILFVAPTGAAGLLRRLVTGRAAVAAWTKPPTAPAAEDPGA
jgi:branched-chain amino acid transport system permease protein